MTVRVDTSGVAASGPGSRVEMGSSGLRLETVRRLTPGLQAQIDALASLAQEADGGVSPFGEHKWLRLVRGDDRCAALLLWRQGEVVGAAHCDVYHTPAPEHPCRLSAELVIHPRHRRRGLGSLMLYAVLALAREECADELHLWSYGARPAAEELSRKIGCRVERTLLQLELPAEKLPAPPIFPEHIRLRAFEPRRDAYPWLALHNRVFADHPEQGHWDAADLQARLEQPWFRTEDLLLAEDVATETLLGFCWVKIPLSPDAPGEIYIVGVDPAARGGGLGKLLTQAGLAHMRARGRPGAMLYVEAENMPAIRLYESLGFEQRWVHRCYARAVSQ